MRYLCLVHVDPELIAALDPDGLAAMDRDNRDFDADLARLGKLVTALALAPPETATVVRSRSGGISVTDGPYLETKEILGGVVLIDAESREEAMAIVRRDPMARFGSIELRPELGLEWQMAQQGR